MKEVEAMMDSCTDTCHMCVPVKLTINVIGRQIAGASAVMWVFGADCNGEEQLSLKTKLLIHNLIFQLLDIAMNSK